MPFRVVWLALLAPVWALAQSVPPSTEARIRDLEAAVKSAQSAGDNSWMLVSAALVLMMTGPGLALFYGGLVRRKNVLSTMMHSFVLMAVITVIWAIVGYSLAFGEWLPFIGDLRYLFLNNVGAAPNPDYAATIPQQTYMIYQLMFAIITPALISGAFAERMKFSAMLLFSVLWLFIVYLPLAHMVWGKGGLLNAFSGGRFPCLDFAGGTVVHISSGVSALVCALYLGKRQGYRSEPMKPHSLVLSVVGACLLWVGWFGFNAGSAVGSNGRAGMAMAVTQIATAAAALAWMFAEWTVKGKPSVLGIISGAVAGLVAITPASGFVLPGASIIIGIAAGVICFWCATSVKHLFGYDDSLDVFGVHCTGGIVGALLTGVFSYGPLSATDASPDGSPGGLHQLWIQCQGVAATLVYSGVGTLVLLYITKALVGLRVNEEEEREGLDLVLHGEQIF
jgi:Amt family ammonium transporter